MIEIKHRYTNNVLYVCNADNLKEAVIDAVKNGADLRGADLIGADLIGADLYGADLIDADLRSANLYGANLYGANLIDANLIGADLGCADLSCADLSCADLIGANLYGANLIDANLIGADLFGKKLTKTPLFIYNLQYWCVITEKHMKLGCKVYTHEEWANFTDDEISEMDTKALEFWNVWKEPLLTMCKTHRGES